MKGPETRSKLVFLSACLLITFAYGVIVGHYQLFPFSMIRFGKRSVDALVAESNTLLRIRPDHFLMSARHAGDGVTRLEKDKIAPGLTLLVGFFDRNNELRLIRSDGSIVRRWPIRFHEIFTDTGHLPEHEAPMTDWNVEIHGAVALPDGAVVFNFEYRGMVKLNRCGAVLWKLDRRTHHSVERSDDEGFWVPGMRSVREQASLSFLDPPYEEEFLWKISPSGQMVKEISVLELYRRNHLLALLFFGSLPDRKIHVDEVTMHLNDIKELSREMARHFPQFAPGDLLVSYRDRNTIMVIDPATEKVKWSQTGPWLGQHDPHFKTNGKISVFNNNNDRTETGSVLGGSSIVEVDPSTGKTVRKYGGIPSQRMYSDIRGKHQNLGNGNILIAESQAGRVVEVNENGDIVWEFINRYDADHVAIVSQATRYPDSYFSVQDWTCPGVE